MEKKFNGLIDPDRAMLPSEITTIELLEGEIEKVLLLADKGVIRAMIGAVVANRMALDPVWLLLVAGSSAGKTELLMSMSDLDFIHQISDLTVNTFASGQKKPGKETSLLMKLNNGVMLFKDFTSVLSKNKEAKKEIMGQLREIFDGSYTKRTGTGDDITWKGKVGAIAGCTESIYRHLEDLSEMGDRFVMYSIEAPDRMNAARRAMSNTEGMAEKREHLKKCCLNFVNLVIDQIDIIDPKISLETQEEFLVVADFAALARSAVITNDRTDVVEFVPTPEMPMRIAAQLYTMASALTAINMVSHPERSKEITDVERKILYKIAFDSIPRTRRDALIPLAKYSKGISTAGLAQHIGLPAISVEKYLSQLNALGICSRIKKSGQQGNMWVMKNEYKEIIVNLYDIKVHEGAMMANNFDAEEDDLDDLDAGFDRLVESESLDTW